MNPHEPTSSSPIMPSYEPPKPAGSTKQPAGSEAAANLLREKIKTLYGQEPSAKEEVMDAVEHTRPRSKHQKFMYDLAASGKSLAEIQTAWHNYYVNLSDDERLEVWNEFYESRNASPHIGQSPAQPQQNPLAPPQPVIGEITQAQSDQGAASQKSVADLKRQITSKAKRNNKARLSRKHHLHSLAFGLGLGSLMLIILLFGFFNERFIAPFISPSKQVSSTPIIAGSTTTTDKQAKVIIPKINVEIPVVYGEESVEEDVIQKALESGVVHYATTPEPGQKGNSVIFGHSSNNIFNKGQYKFAFVLLSRLENNDLFYLTKDGKRYTYRVYEKKIVKPSEISVLDTASRPDTASLITCDPPGTSLNRLVVIGEQISPDPSANKTSTTAKNTRPPAVIPSNSPSLWDRLTSWL